MRVFVFLFFVSINLFAQTKNDVLHDFGCSNSSTSRCYFFSRNLERDIKGCYVPKYKMDHLNFYFRTKHVSKKYSVAGGIAYRGFYPGRYRYNVSQNKDDKITITASVHFYNKSYSSGDVQGMLAKFKWASEYWSKNNPYHSNIKFKFSVTSDITKANLVVYLMDEETRGPYFLRWSKKWSNLVVAHELGHLMGLDDEYESKTQDCPDNSVMCSGGRNKAYEYHYYLILRRLICS